MEEIKTKKAYTLKDIPFLINNNKVDTAIRVLKKYECELCEECKGTGTVPLSNLDIDDEPILDYTPEHINEALVLCTECEGKGYIDPNNEITDEDLFFN